MLLQLPLGFPSVQWGGQVHPEQGPVSLTTHQGIAQREHQLGCSGVLFIPYSISALLGFDELLVKSRVLFLEPVQGCRVWERLRAFHTLCPSTHRRSAAPLSR